MTVPSYAVGLWVFGPTPDRYLPSGYHDNEDLDQKLARIAAIPHVSAVEMPFGPVMTSENVEVIAQKVRDAQLSISSLTVNVVGMQKWAKGSVTNPNPNTRAEAITLIHQAMKAARRLGVSTVNLWMGQEGYDYIFESDYESLWVQLCQGLAEAAREVPEVNLGIEYKKMEPRVRNVPSSSAQALLATLESGCQNLGVTLDIGHAIMGGENASEQAALLNHYRKLFHIHINDNLGNWDWDMAAGCDHWWQLVEFCYYMQEINYTRPYVIDVFPYRQSPERVCALSIKAFQKAWDIAQKLDRDMVKRAMACQDGLAVYEMLLEC